MELKRKAFEVQEVISRYHLVLLGIFYHLSSPILFVALVTSHVILTEGLPYSFPTLVTKFTLSAWQKGDKGSFGFQVIMIVMLMTMIKIDKV